jgi:hypothetical protein
MHGGILTTAETDFTEQKRAAVTENELLVEIRDRRIPCLAQYQTKDMPPPLPDISTAILIVRGERVILDADLAVTYGVATKRLNEQVKRNADRFPPDFSFQLIEEEKAEVVANCDHLARLKFSPVLPRIGFHVKEDALPYRTRKRGKERVGL